MPNAITATGSDSKEPLPVLQTWRIPLAVLTLAFLIGGYFYYRFEMARTLVDKHRVIAGIGELKGGQIEQWRFERLADARTGAQDPLLVDAARRFLRDTSAAALGAALRTSLAVRAGAYRYPEVLLASLDGIVFAASGKEGEGTMRAPESAAGSAFAKVAGGGGPLITPFYRSPDGTLRIDVLAALPDSAGKPFAVLVLRCDPEIYFLPLLRFWPSGGRTARTWVVEERGGEVAYLGNPGWNEGSGLDWRTSPRGAAPPAVGAALWKQGHFEGTDADGNQLLADLRSVPGSPWKLAVQVDADEIMAEGRYRMRAIAALVAAMTLLLMATWALFHRQRQASLFKERYLAERRRREDQEERRSLLDSIGDAVITTDIRGRVRELNPAAADLTGWSESEARGRPLEEVLRVVDRTLPTWPGYPGAPVEPGQGPQAETHAVLIRRDGVERPVLRNVSSIRGLDGESAGTVVVFSDQSRQHAARQALRDSEAKFRSVLENMALIGVIIDGKGNVQVCSDYLLELTGWSRSEVIGRSWFERFIPMDSRKPVREGFDRVLAAGELPRHYENEIVTRQGRRHHVSWSSHLLRAPEGAVVGMVGIGEDITERKAAEDRLRQSEQRLQLLIEHCPGAIAMFDMEMRYLVASPRWLEDYHLGNTEIIGRSHYEVFPDIPERWKAIHRRCLLGAIEKCEEDPFPRAAGGTEWIRWEIHPWRDDRGDIGGIVMFTEVITPRKQAEEDLRKLNAELELRVQERTAQLAEKNKELETFSYSVSHDLKAPLRGIDGYSKILLDEYADRIDEEGRGFLKNIRAGTAQMQQLIEDMLDYSKLERRSISLAPVDLGNVVRKVLEERAFDLGEAVVTVEVAEGAVSADHEGLSMVVRNLIDNAFKFSRLRKPPKVEIRSRLAEGRHILSIKDNGTGFAMKHHDLIFQIFQRLHRAEEYGGTGVGLAIVRKAMDRMDGKVWAESEPDRGATFYIDLPAAERVS